MLLCIATAVVMVVMHSTVVVYYDAVDDGVATEKPVFVVVHLTAVYLMLLLL